MVRDKRPEKYAKDLSLKITEKDHQKIKELAEEKRTTIKGLIFMALDIAFPGWDKDK
ncbi:MAG: hypothetical protein OSJ28_10985 [Desulfovibrio sp.]|nr:hypothetical protein [Desulfovibrio sp.]